MEMFDDNRKYLSLDALRGVAAISVAILHMPHFFNGWNLPGSFLAVDLFFVMSGFVLCLAYEKKFHLGMTAWQFIRLRVIRLYPLYFLSSALGFLVGIAALFSSGLSVDWSPKLLVATIPFSLMILPTPQIGRSDVLFPLNPVLWSIFYEMFINIIYVAFFRVLRNTGTVVGVVILSGAALVALTMSYGRLDAGFSWATMPLGFARVGFSFFIGVLIRRMSKNAVRKEGVMAFLLIGATLVIFALASEVWAQLVSAMLLFPIIVWLAVRVEPAYFHKTFNAAGVASYAIYALHKPAYQLTLGALIIALPFRPEALAPWIGCIFIPVIFGASLFVDKIYDYPVRRWLSRASSPNSEAMRPG